MQRGPGVLVLFVVAACSSTAGPGPARDEAPPAPVTVPAAPVPPDAALVVDAPAAPVDAAAPPDAGPARTQRRPRRRNHNAICRLGHGRFTPPDRGPLPKVETCAPGLECCYPCGIQGCDWVCHTPQECAVDRSRP